jgi:hypothetical protein
VDHLEQKNHILRWHHNEFNQDIFNVCQSLSSELSFCSQSTKKKNITKQRKFHKGNHVNFSPKTTDDLSKRRMSVSYE